MTERLELKAYGKINLGLDVVRKREDGYHEVRMIMQTVDLYDRITMERMESGIRVTANLPYVPDGEGNLAYRAAKLLMEEFGITEGISIEIKKMIPVAAGMAGGSTDAAAVLVGVNRMFGLGLTKKELMERGVRLGADVPYCILRGTALSEGIGEILTELPAPPPCTLVIAKPPVSVSTKEVYGRLDLKALRPEDHPDIDGMAEAIRTGDLAGITSRLGNVLELVREGFGSNSRDFVTAVDENSVIIVKELAEQEGTREVDRTAEAVGEFLKKEGIQGVRIAYGTIVKEIKEVSRSYKEAKMALDVGKIFFDERDIIAYNELGIGRLIYQLPIPLCKMFIKEIFGGKSPDDFDEETLTTINKFFENSLNVSETSRQLFIHRNTLVYRLDKLQKSTGLDLRVFEDAITFKIALMVVKYMKYMETFEY